MAKADRQAARKFVYLEVVTIALSELGLSDESIRRGVFRGCGDGSIGYRHAGEDPPPGFWRTELYNVTFVASDIKNMLVLPASAGAVGLEEITLFDVELAWEDVVAKYPALRDIEPPQEAMPARRQWKKGEEIEWLFWKIDQHPPPPEWKQKPAWASARFREMNIDFNKTQAWQDDDTIRRKLDDVLRGRLRRPGEKK